MDREKEQDEGTRTIRGIMIGLALAFGVIWIPTALTLWAIYR